MLKRTIDIIIALIGLLILLPFFPIIWLILKIRSKGSVVIKEERVGRKEKIIHLYRFSAGDSTISQNGKEGSQSLTLFNKFFNVLKVERWPLLLNILKGELSFVGPFPEKYEYVREYSKEQKEILTVRPGIFGPYHLIDIYSKNGLSQSSITEEEYRRIVLPEKIKVELQYVRNKFLGKDLKILAGVLIKKITNMIHDQLMREAKDRNFFLPLDLFLIFFSYFLAYQLRFEWSVPKNEYFVFIKSLPLLLIIRVVTFYYFGLYKNLWKYVGVNDLFSIINSCTISSVLFIAAIYILGISSHSRSILFIDWLLCFLFIGGSRVMLRIFSENYRNDNTLKHNVLIIGAGDVGEMLLRELNKNGRSKYHVVGFIDDDEDKHGRTIHGVKVLGSCDEIPEIAPLLRVDEVLITGNQFSSDEMKAILNYCKQAGVRHRIVPAVSDLLSGAVHLSRFRKVEISDLFGRNPVELDLSAIKNFLHGKTIMVTGAGGSIGSELCRQIAEYHPLNLILVDKNENYLHETRCDLEAMEESVKIVCSLSDVTNETKQRQLFEKYKPEIVFHAAAQKHVPLSEENPEEAVWNNVFGTKVIASLADEYGVKVFVLMSTDKAVNPTSVMGVTKRIAELYIQALGRKSRTRFVAVRFGNVLNSHGSVVPTFMKQIERGGPVTVTHPVVRRYFMSVSEAVQLILQAATLGHSSEIFILNMGKSISILDLAIELIKHAGLKPYEDIPIKFTGLRPGEKLFEELIGQDEELLPTSHTGIKKLKFKRVVSLDELDKQLTALIKPNCRIKVQGLKRKLQNIVPEYVITTKPVVIPEEMVEEPVEHFV